MNAWTYALAIGQPNVAAGWDAVGLHERWRGVTETNALCCRALPRSQISLEANIGCGNYMKIHRLGVRNLSVRPVTRRQAHAPVCSPQCPVTAGWQLYRMSPDSVRAVAQWIEMLVGVLFLRREVRLVIKTATKMLSVYAGRW